jgi:hypothetical protein
MKTKRVNNLMNTNDKVICLNSDDPCCGAEDPICCQIEEAGGCPFYGPNCQGVCINGSCQHPCGREAGTNCKQICDHQGSCINENPCCGDADPACCQKEPCESVTVLDASTGRLAECETICVNGDCIDPEPCCKEQFENNCCNNNYCNGVLIDGCSTICIDGSCVKQDPCCGSDDDCCESKDPCCQINQNGGCVNIDGCKAVCINGQCVVEDPCCLSSTSTLNEDCCYSSDKLCCQLEKSGLDCSLLNTDKCTYTCQNGICVPSDVCCNDLNPDCCNANRDFKGCDSDKNEEVFSRYDPDIACDILGCRRIDGCPPPPPVDCHPTCTSIHRRYENGCLVEVNCLNCDCPDVPPPINCGNDCVPVPVNQGGCQVGWQCECGCDPAPPPITCNEPGCSPEAIMDGDCVVGWRCKCECPLPPNPIDCGDCDTIEEKDADGCVTGYRCDCDCDPVPPPIVCPPDCDREPIVQGKCIIGWKCSNVMIAHQLQLLSTAETVTL